MSIVLSFVIPCYKSESTIEEVVSRLQNTVEQRYRKSDYEIILVDDCSPDGTGSVLERLSETNSSVTVLSFTKNFGQLAALMAGFSRAQGQTVVTLDDDGQTQPEEVFKLIDRLNEGYDVVFARYEARADNAFRSFGTWVNAKMAEALIDKPKDVYISSFYAVKYFIIDEVLRYKSSFPYIAGLLLRATSKVADISVEHAPRLAGKSGYSFKKLFSLWLNGFTSFSVKPLRVASILGLFMAFAGFVSALVLIWQRLIDPSTVLGWTSIVVVLLILGGIVLLILGLLGEYVGKTHIASTNAPQYVIRPHASEESFVHKSTYEEKE